MSQSNNNGDGSNNNQNQNAAGPKVTWGTKVGYIGTGVLIGLVIYPFVRKALSKVQPKVDKIFDDLTGRAEDLAERASDIMARAKSNLYQTEAHGHGHSHSHAHGDEDNGPVQ